ncbi:MAG TPA: alpha/beta hydrolase [Steroidobacteraceae bacterium]|nr:alpha/beta hydrolase [Steroidobacteraceae bacterium]
MGWTTGSCAASGVAIHYERTGGAKRPMLLLHGLSGSGACWRCVARALESEFDLLMPDARGHGASDTPASGYSYEYHAGDVVGLIRQLELVDPVILGHSMGGLTATLVASRLGHAIRALVLVDPTFLSPQRQREVHASDVVEQHRRLLGKSRDEVVADLRTRHPHRSAEMVGLLAEARLHTRLNAFDVLRPPNPDYQQLVKVIAVPILLAIGDQPVVSIETARGLQQLNPSVRIAQIPGAGHGLPYDQPERLAAAVGSFLRSLAVR